MLHIRVDDDINEQATQAFSLELKEPNPETRAAMEESRAMMASRRPRFATAAALFDDLDKNGGK